jgi:hypothetical protein
LGGRFFRLFLFPSLSLSFSLFHIRSLPLVRSLPPPFLSLRSDFRLEIRLPQARPRSSAQKLTGSTNIPHPLTITQRANLAPKPVLFIP